MCRNCYRLKPAVTVTMTAQMEKRDAAFNKMVDVKKFNEK